MAKKSATETKSLKGSCVGEIKNLDSGGFTCKNKDGKWITCTPNNDSTSNCWITAKEPNISVLEALFQARQALQQVERALEETIAPTVDEDESKAGSSPSQYAEQSSK